jgi:hypothetical protein
VRSAWRDGKRRQLEFWEVIMRIVATALLSVVFLGATINDGWCPQPANLGAYTGGSTGATGAATYDSPKTPPYPTDPKAMTWTQRMNRLPHERAAGRVTNEQQARNFLQTGDPTRSYTPPPPKTLTKPPSMSDAQWQQVLATRPKPQTYVTTAGMPKGTTVEEAARKQGGSMTTTAAATPAATPAPAKPAAAAPVGRSSLIGGGQGQERRLKALDPAKPNQPGIANTRLVLPAPASSAMDRLGGGPSPGASHGVLGGGGNRTGSRSGVAPMKDAGRPMQQAQPRPAVTPPAARGPIDYGGCGGCGKQDTFRQPR